MIETVYTITGGTLPDRGVRIRDAHHAGVASRMGYRVTAVTRGSA